MKQMFFRRLGWPRAALLLTLLLAAAPALAAQPAAPATAPARSAGSVPGSSDDYVIGDGDSLSISIWGEKELGGTVNVRPDGKITLEAIGDVTAAGFTPMKLADDLAERLKKVVNKAIVTVTVTGITNNKVYLFGGGVAPGVLNMADRTTLLRLFCRLGSLKTADLERACIYRDGKKLDTDFYAVLVKGELAKDPPLKPGDIIYVPDNEANKIYVMGAVMAPKSVYHREGLRVLDAILEAGGFNKFAKENDVMVFRKGAKEMIEVKAKDLIKEGDLSQNIRLQPGDLVIVNEGIF